MDQTDVKAGVMLIRDATLHIRIKEQDANPDAAVAEAAQEAVADPVHGQDEKWVGFSAEYWFDCTKQWQAQAASASRELEAMTKDCDAAKINRDSWKHQVGVVQIKAETWRKRAVAAEEKCKKQATPIEALRGLMKGLDRQCGCLTSETDAARYYVKAAEAELEKLA